MQAPVQIAGQAVAAPADWAPEVYDNKSAILPVGQPVWNESDIGKYDFDLPNTHHHQRRGLGMPAESSESDSGSGD